MNNPKVARTVSGISWFAIAVLLSVNSLKADGTKKTEMAQLEGEWTMVSGEADGMLMSKAMTATGKRVAKDGETTISMAGQLYFKAKFNIDPAKKPKTIDYKMTEGPTKGKTQLGIYELNGDTLKFCFGAPGKERPTEFSAKAGSLNTLSVWKREKN